jgi:hypothetical protein
LVKPESSNDQMNFLKNNAGIKNLHLLLSVIVIIPIALAYGLYPKLTLSQLFGIKVETINLTSIFRALMGLYLAVSAVWILGILKPRFWTTATVMNIVFMGGLAAGRLLSLVVDGVPSLYFLAGLLVELLFAFWGLRNLKKYKNSL